MLSADKLVTCSGAPFYRYLSGLHMQAGVALLRIHSVIEALLLLFLPLFQPRLAPPLPLQPASLVRSLRRCAPPSSASAPASRCSSPLASWRDRGFTSMASRWLRPMHQAELRTRSSYSTALARPQSSLLGLPRCRTGDYDYPAHSMARSEVCTSLRTPAHPGLQISENKKSKHENLKGEHGESSHIMINYFCRDHQYLPSLIFFSTSLPPLLLSTL
ncbi:hypothetical protein FB451DRAFT_1388188 [Mycena latifolia]|nr:hypothetical protein FB451DRAFT_1388188 [Mycena latifolia]